MYGDLASEFSRNHEEANVLSPLLGIFLYVFLSIVLGLPGTEALVCKNEGISILIANQIALLSNCIAGPDRCDGCPNYSPGLFFLGPAPVQDLQSGCSRAPQFGLGDLPGSPAAVCVSFSHYIIPGLWEEQG